MTDVQRRAVIAGIRIKMGRGEKLEDILSAYANLSEKEKESIQTELEG